MRIVSTDWRSFLRKVIKLTHYPKAIHSEIEWDYHTRDCRDLPRLSSFHIVLPSGSPIIPEACIWGRATIPGDNPFITVTYKNGPLEVEDNFNLDSTDGRRKFKEFIKKYTTNI